MLQELAEKVTRSAILRRILGPSQPTPSVPWAVYRRIAQGGVELFASDTTARFGWYPLTPPDVARSNFLTSLAFVMADPADHTVLKSYPQEKDQLREARAFVHRLRMQAKKEPLIALTLWCTGEEKMDRDLARILTSPDAREQLKANLPMQNLKVRARQWMDSFDKGAFLSDLENAMPGLSGIELASNVRQQELRRQQLVRGLKSATEMGQTEFRQRLERIAFLPGTPVAVEEHRDRLHRMFDFYRSAALAAMAAKAQGPGALSTVPATLNQVRTGTYFLGYWNQLNDPQRLDAAKLPRERSGAPTAASKRAIMSQFIDFIASNENVSHDALAHEGIANLVLLARNVLTAKVQQDAWEKMQKADSGMRERVDYFLAYYRSETLYWPVLDAVWR